MECESVLIVDDNELNLRLVKAILVRDGYRVESASSAADARRVLATFKPQLILMDVQLPDANGVEFARELKSEPDAGDLVIVALTAYSAPGDADRAKAAGCDGYITKPIDPRTLAVTLRGYLDVST